MSERRVIQPIAPAGDSHRFAKVPDEPIPPKMPDIKPPRAERLSMSKQWVLPPRPKPGRKPKKANADKAAKSAKPVAASRRSSDASPARRVSSTEAKVVAKIEMSSEGGSEAANDASSDSCGLCTREDCMCEEIGLKDTTPASPAEPAKRPSITSLPSLDVILNQSTIKMDAVPIKRLNKPYMGSSASMAKFKKAHSFEPMQPTKFKKAHSFEPMQPTPVMSVPSPLESMHLNPDTGCGFCSENTVCVCAETAAPSTPLPPATATPQQQQQPSPGHQHQQQMKQQVMLPPITTPESDQAALDDVYGCSECERGPMSMLFCVSLSAASPLAAGAVAIPCNLAFKTLQKHHKFDGCDLGKLMQRLECSKKMVGVQSINRVLQDLERNEFVSKG